MRALIVDVGSNSIRSMEAEFSHGDFGFFHKRVYTTRLAEGLVQTGRLSRSRMDQSLACLQLLAQEAAEKDVLMLIYATSAVRDAENRNDFLNDVLLNTGCRIDVLDGETEARYALLGATGGSGGLIDIGGGSTQIVTASTAVSFPLGCVRARDLCGDVNDLDALSENLLPHLKAYIELPHISSDNWTGVGGSITTLAACSLGLTCYNRLAVQSYCFSYENIKNTLHSIAALGASRCLHPLLRERHDIILQGGSILLFLMNGLSIPVIRVSDADGMEGYAMARMKK